MDSLDVDVMPAQSCGALGVGVMNSTTEHEISGMGCFSGVYLGKRMMILYYSGTLMYINLYINRYLG